MAKRVFPVLLVGVASFLGGAFSLTLSSRLEKVAVAQDVPRAQAAAPVVTDLIAIGDRFELVAKRVCPAVVSVEARRVAEKTTNGSRTVEESGSGVIVRMAGWRHPFVLTNEHVISDTPANQITIHLADGRLYRPTRVWTDRESDVAVLALEGLEDVPAATLGDSDTARVGNWVLAIGSPFGLNQTVTHGIISARARGQINLGSTIRIKDFLQTDAAINPGSSGGPLVNLNGEVIGINTAIASPSGNNSGVSFSIPINLFRQVALQLLEKGGVSRGYLGIQLSHAFEPADALRLGLQKTQGALVEAVFPSTPAASAGLKAGDVILHVDQVEIGNENQLINHISNTPAGRSIELSVWREQKLVRLNAVVGDWSKVRNNLR